MRSRIKYERADRSFRASAFEKRSDEDWYRVTMGYVLSPHGVVGIQQYANDRAKPKPSRGVYLSFVIDGVHHWRCLEGKEYTERGLVSLARRYAAEKAGA